MRDAGLHGKIALVTGAGGGIGAAVVRQLSEEGVRVVASDLVTPAGLDTTERLRAEALDVRDSGAVEALVDRVEREWGPIDLGVNVAGVLATEPVADTDDATWRNVFAVNSDGVFHVSRALARRMTPRRRGAMVTVGSNAAGIPRQAMAAYAASKAAATMFIAMFSAHLVVR